MTIKADRGYPNLVSLRALFDSVVNILYTLFTLNPFHSLRVWLILVLCILNLCASPAFAAGINRTELHARMQRIVSNERLDTAQRQKALVALASNERERAWLIYQWVTTHFKHDAGLASLIGDPDKLSLDRLFRAGGGSCAVFANVLHRLLQNAGLEVKTIYGLAKGGEAATRVNGVLVNHVWNVVKIDGVWYMLDATWGAGYVGRDGFHREQSDLFFMVPPQRAALSHFDPADQHGYQARLGLDQAKFDRIAEDATYVAAVGFDVASILKLQADGQRKKLVETFNPIQPSFKVIDAPITARLRKQALKLRIESSEYEELMVLQGKTWTPMRKEGNQHSIEYEPLNGELMVMARRAKEHEFEALLAYSVK